MTSAAVPYLDGHCGHEWDAEPKQDRGNGAASGYTGGSKSGPESARTDRGLRPAPTKEN